MDIHENILSLIGNTPVLKLGGYMAAQNLAATLLCKLESFNVSGSAKDRVALNMIYEAEKSGQLQKGAVIIEPTSGNTGIALAAIGAVKGYKVILTMPDTMSPERQKLLKMYGAEVVLTDGKKGMQDSIDKAIELAASYKNAFIPSQFENPANPESHYLSTGKELWEATGGKIDILVATVGTGGTLSGVGKYLKEKNPAIKIYAVEPSDSPVLSKGIAGSHKIQGIGAGFVPKTLDTKIYDGVITASTDEAFAAARVVAKTDGILIGISSGAALHAAKTLAEKPENANKTIVVIFTDGGEKYLSTELFDC